jgi:ParB family chromosome partitioning protein
VHPNRYQPRTRFDEAALDELAASIRVLGVLQPVLVRPTADGYELIAGERRWRAAQLAGLAEVPALVRDVEHQSSLEHALVENLHREDLNPVEEAVAYRQLIDDFGLSHDDVAARVGKSRSAVTNTLRLLQLPPEVLELLVDRRLSAGHARALLGLADPAEQRALASTAVADGWSVRQTEAAVKARAGRPDGTEPGAGGGGDPVPTPGGPSDGASRPAALLELEELLSEHLDTRVAVQLGGRRGRVIIEFGGIEDLERIYRAMVTGPERG